MRRTEWLQETRRMRFEEAYDGWHTKRLTQAEAARLLGVCDRTFRRYVERYDDEGMEGLRDKRLTQVSPRKAPGAEVQDVVDRYRNRHQGWNVKHFYCWYQRDAGKRGYTWVKTALQEAGLVVRGKGKGAHRKKRERSPWPGMMVHQDGSTHEWVPGQHWDLIVTMDDATSTHYSMVFVDEEGTQSSFLGVQQTLEAQGLFCSLYTDRGSHYWHTSEAGGKVDKNNLTQFGRAMQQLGIELIAAYSPEARGRWSEPLAPTRVACRRNWRCWASRNRSRPTATSARSTCPTTTRSSRTPPPSQAPHSFPCWESISTRSSVSTTNARWAKTTACTSNGGCCRSRQIPIAATT